MTLFLLFVGEWSANRQLRKVNTWLGFSVSGCLGMLELQHYVPLTLQSPDLIA